MDEEVKVADLVWLSEDQEWARLDDDNNIVGLRTFVKGESPPQDISHKGVRWRRIITQPVVYDPEVEDLNSNLAVVGDEVHRVEEALPKDPEPLRQLALAQWRAFYHSAILDAMPNMTSVQAICIARDATYARISKEADYTSLKAMLNAKS